MLRIAVALNIVSIGWYVNTVAQTYAIINVEVSKMQKMMLQSTKVQAAGTFKRTYTCIITYLQDSSVTVFSSDFSSEAFHTLKSCPVTEI